MRFNAEIYSKEFHPETEPTANVKATLKKPEPKTEEVEEVEEVDEAEEVEEVDEAEEVEENGSDSKSDSE